MQVSEFIIKVREMLVDPDEVRWTDVEMMSWLDSGYGQLLTHRPDANAQLITHTCVAGPLQTIDPALNGPLLLDVTRNIKTIDTVEVPGTPVHLVSLELADMLLDTWYTSPAASDSQVAEYMYDDRIPANFYVSPNATAETKLEIAISVIPSRHIAVTETIPVNLRYIEALVDYVAYRAYLRDSSNSHSKDMAKLFLQSFSSTLGIKLSIDNAAQPAAIKEAI